MKITKEWARQSLEIYIMMAIGFCVLLVVGFASAPTSSDGLAFVVSSCVSISIVISAGLAGFWIKYR